MDSESLRIGKGLGRWLMNGRGGYRLGGNRLYRCAGIIGTGIIGGMLVQGGRYSLESSSAEDKPVHIVRVKGPDQPYVFHSYNLIHCNEESKLKFSKMLNFMLGGMFITCALTIAVLWKYRWGKVISLIIGTGTMAGFYHIYSTLDPMIMGMYLKEDKENVTLQIGARDLHLLTVPISSLKSQEGEDATYVTYPDAKGNLQRVNLAQEVTYIMMEGFFENHQLIHDIINGRVNEVKKYTYRPL